MKILTITIPVPPGAEVTLSVQGSASRNISREEVRTINDSMDDQKFQRLTETGPKQVKLVYSHSELA